MVFLNPGGFFKKKAFLWSGILPKIKCTSNNNMYYSVKLTTF